MLLLPEKVPPPGQDFPRDGAVDAARRVLPRGGPTGLAINSGMSGNSGTYADFRTLSPRSEFDVPVDLREPETERTWDLRLENFRGFTDAAQRLRDEAKVEESTASDKSDGAVKKRAARLARALTALAKKFHNTS